MCLLKYILEKKNCKQTPLFAFIVDLWTTHKKERRCLGWKSFSHHILFSCSDDFVCAQKIYMKIYRGVDENNDFFFFLCFHYFYIHFNEWLLYPLLGDNSHIWIWIINFLIKSCKTPPSICDANYSLGNIQNIGRLRFRTC